MNAIKREKNRNYTTISNVFLRDKNLSIKAKGFLAVIMSLPEDWDFTINGISAILREGKTAIYSTISELKSKGYCKMDKCKTEKGVIIGNDYSFSEFPKDEWIKVNENPYTENPYMENPDMDNQGMGNQPQRNKDDKEIKNKQNKKDCVIPNEITQWKICGDSGKNSDFPSFSSGGPDGYAANDGNPAKTPERKVAQKESTPKEPWREDFDEYMKLVKEGAAALKADANFRAEVERLQPNVDYEKTIEWCVSQYWGTETGWEKKRRSKRESVTSIVPKSTSMRSLSRTAISKLWTMRIC